jgi:hypothetical protein
MRGAAKTILVVAAFTALAAPTGVHAQGAVPPTACVPAVVSIPMALDIVCGPMTLRAPPEWTTFNLPKDQSFRLEAWGSSSVALWFNAYRVRAGSKASSLNGLEQAIRAYEGKSAAIGRVALPAGQALLIAGGRSSEFWLLHDGVVYAYDFVDSDPGGSSATLIQSAMRSVRWKQDNLSTSLEATYYPRSSMFLPPSTRSHPIALTINKLEFRQGVWSAEVTLENGSPQPALVTQIDVARTTNATGRAGLTLAPSTSYARNSTLSVPKPFRLNLAQGGTWKGTIQGTETATRGRYARLVIDYTVGSRSYEVSTDPFLTPRLGQS